MCSCGLIFMLHIFWNVNVFDVIFASRGNSVSPFPPWQMGKTTLNPSTQSPDSRKSITSSMQNPGSRGVSLKDLDLLKGFRGSRGRFLICLRPGRTSVDEQLLQNQSWALISLPVSQSSEAGSSVCCYQLFSSDVVMLLCSLFFPPKNAQASLEIVTALSQCPLVTFL